MDIKEVEISKIKPYKNNAKKHPKEQVSNIAESIVQLGWRQPIVLDGNGVIIIGHGRFLAAKKLQLKTVPCHYAEDLTEEQVKKLRLLDNKLNESDWDMDFLKVDLEDLDFDGFDIDWGLEVDNSEEVEVVEDDIPEVNEKQPPKTKLGDIWKLGNHRLMCGDSTNKETVEKLMDGAKADLLITDPPYNVAYEGKTEDALTIENDSMSGEEFRAFLQAAFERANESLKSGGAFYVWYASREHINFETALNNVGLQVREQLIWVKNSLVLGRQDYHWKHEPCLYGWKDGAPHNWYSDRSQTTVLEFNRPTRNGEHPTMKPLDLIGYQIQNSSRKKDIVLDLFGGSGSTLIACEKLGRRCRTMELDPKYCDVIIKRWETLTGKTAELVNGD
jgi:site-specific DNA-methyltransferase (adenine-specific)